MCRSACRWWLPECGAWLGGDLRAHHAVRAHRPRLSQYDLDSPVEDVHVTGIQGLFDTARRVANRDNLTLRDVGKWYAQGVLLPQFV